jgi:hypothetical protein
MERAKAITIVGSSGTDVVVRTFTNILLLRRTGGKSSLQFSRRANFGMPVKQSFQLPLIVNEDRE